MKTILYLATTINGMIAKPDGDSDFVSKEQTEDFLLRCRQAGVVIMGRKTYEIIETLPLKDGLHIVLSHNTPEAIVIGGAETASEFLQANLVDEVYLNIEPVIFGEGMPLATPASFEAKLNLLETKMLSPQVIQLRYKVVR